MALIRLPRLLPLPFKGRRETGAPEGGVGLRLAIATPTPHNSFIIESDASAATCLRKSKLRPSGIYNIMPVEQPQLCGPAVPLLRVGFVESRLVPPADVHDADE